MPVATAPVIVTPNSTALLFHYLGSMLGYTLLVVVGLVLVAAWLKKHPEALKALKKRLGIPVPAAEAAPAPNMVLEETLTLVGNRQLAIVNCHGERILLSVQGEEVQFLTKLAQDAGGVAEALSPPPEQPPLSEERLVAAALDQVSYTRSHIDERGDITLSHGNPLFATPSQGAGSANVGVSSPWQHIGLPKLWHGLGKK